MYKGVMVAPSTTTAAQVWIWKRNQAELRQRNSA